MYAVHELHDFVLAWLHCDEDGDSEAPDYEPSDAEGNVEGVPVGRGASSTPA